MHSLQCRRRFVWLVVLLGTLTAASSLATDVYVPSLPTLKRIFSVDSGYVQYSLSLFFAGLAFGQLIYGPISDRYGRKPVLVFGFSLYLVASAACALAGSMTTIILARAAQGLGAASGQVIPRAIVRDRFSGSRAASIISFVVMVMAIAPLIAPLIGSLIVTIGSWRDIFWLLCGYAGVCLAALTIGLRESHARESRIRDRSLLTQYLDYLTLLRRGPFIWFLACGALMFGVLFSFITASSFVYISQFNVDKTTFGFYFSFNMIAMLAGNLINGRLVPNVGYFRMLGFAVTNTLSWTLILLMTTLSGLGGLWGVVIPVFMLLLTVSMAGANTVAGLLDLAPDTAGAASALFGVCQCSCGALAIVVISMLGGDAQAMATVMTIAASGAASAYLIMRCRSLHPISTSADR